MNIKTIKKCLEHFPVSRAILFKGGHGIGKSSFWKDIAKESGQSYLDIRLGQMTEGDLLGLYEIQDNKTCNFPPEWYVQACSEPCILHFDELNRALPNVIQGVFQIILDRCLGKNMLHPGTRVAASINTGAEYDVLSLDPALLDRFAQIDFEPTKEEFLIWGEKHLNYKIIDFLSVNHSHIECEALADKVTPSRRAWAFLSEDISGLLDNKDYSLIYSIAQTEVGNEAASAFAKYLDGLKEYSHLDILDRFNKKMLNSITESGYARLTDSVIKHIVCDGDFGRTRQANFRKFINELPDEFVASAWRHVCSTEKASLVGELMKGALERAL